MGALVYDCREEIERAINRLREEGATSKEIQYALMNAAIDLHREEHAQNDTE
jgi:hypothetical protein